MKCKFLLSLACMFGVGVFIWMSNSKEETPPLPTMDDIDHKIVELQEKFGTKPARDFFAEGGTFMDAPFQGQSLDATVILPLVERICAETDREPLAIFFPESPQRAGAMVVPLPQTKEELHALQKIFIEADHNFNGVILRAYGNHWMQFELMDAASAKASDLENWDIEEEVLAQNAGT